MASLVVLDQVEDAPLDLQAARRSAASPLVQADPDQTVGRFARYRFNPIPKHVAAREVLLGTVGLARAMPLENNLIAAVSLI